MLIMQTTLTFVSALSDEYGHSLPAILQKSFDKYRSLQIRSLMLFSRGNIMQALEGETDAVQSVFDYISRDCRHMHVQTLLRQRGHSRSGVESGFGYRRLDRQILHKICPAIPVFTLTSLEIANRVRDGKVQLLMQQFASN